MTFFVLTLLFLAVFGLASAQTYFAAEGGNVTGQCKFHVGGVKKIFCKNNCDKKEDILAETTGDSGRNGRYGIEYTRQADSRIMRVTIAHVTSADSGEYQCVMERMVSKARRKFSINVTAAPAQGQMTSTSTEQNLYFLFLLILIPAILVVVFVIYKKKKMLNDCEQAKATKTVHENIYAPEPADSTYQSLSPDTRDHNQIYWSLRAHQPPRTVDYCNC